MPVIQYSLKVPYNPREMYELVNDIEAYPQFLPGCYESKILTQNEHEMQARLTIGKDGFSKSFTTHNRLYKDKIITLHLVDGPFKHLEGCWFFVPIETGGCTVSLKLTFEFTHQWFNFPFNIALKKGVKYLLKAFTERANHLYKK